MERTAPLTEHESVSAEGLVRSKTSVVFRRLSYLRVSTVRVCLVRHYAFRPDTLLEVPRAAIISVVADGRWTDIEMNHEGGKQVVKLRPWEGRLRRLVVEHVLDLDRDELRRVLDPGPTP